MAKESSEIFDNNLLLSNLKKALREKETYLNNGFLYEQVAYELIDRISNPHHKDEFKYIAEIGYRNPKLSNLITQKLEPAIYDAYIECDELKNLNMNDKIIFKSLNKLDHQITNHGYDLFINNLTFTIYNQLPQIFMHLNHLLNKGGMIKGALLGEGSLNELRQSLYETESKVKGGISPRVAPFVGIKDLGNLLAHSNFTEIITDRDIINISYSDPYKLLNEIKSQGLNNTLKERSKYPMNKAFLHEALKYYQDHFKAYSNSDHINVRIEIIYYSALKA